MNAERSEGPFDSDPSRWRRAVKRSKVAGPLVGLGAAAVLKLGGDAAEPPVFVHRLASQPVPEYVGAPDFTFQGERPPDTELFYWADSVANEYWNQLGHGRSNCENHLSVLFTDHFGGYDNPHRQPSAAIDCSLEDLWLNQDPALAENPWNLARVLAHEYGHARGFSHSHDPDSIMFVRRGVQNHGVFTNPPPSGATVERFRQVFLERVKDLPGSESR